MNKKALVVFGILDLIVLSNIIRLQIIAPANLILFTIIDLVFMISLLFSSVNLIRQNKLGCIISYFQFPFRFFFYNLSFGFLLYLNRGLIALCVLLEIARLVMTIMIHRNLQTS